jgi:transcriptional regulator with XRE-family HTH domain
LNTIADILKKQRIKRKLLLREVAASIQIDSAILSKYEKGIRLPTRKQIIKFAKYFRISEDKLLTIWLSDKIVDILSNNSEIALNTLTFAKEKIKYVIH